MRHGPFLARLVFANETAWIHIDFSGQPFLALEHPSLVPHYFTLILMPFSAMLGLSAPQSSSLKGVLYIWCPHKNWVFDPLSTWAWPPPLADVHVPSERKTRFLEKFSVSANFQPFSAFRPLKILTTFLVVYSKMFTHKSYISKKFQCGRQHGPYPRLHASTWVWPLHVDVINGWPHRWQNANNLRKPVYKTMIRPVLI